MTYRMASVSILALLTACSVNDVADDAKGANGAPKADATDVPATSDDAGASQDGAAPPTTTAMRWQPRPGTTWQWQLSGTGEIDTSVDAQAFDIDLFDTSAATFTVLKNKGRKIICYFDTAYEPGRPDSSMLAPYKHNPVEGWPGQYWLDVGAPAVVEVMKARIALAQSKGCDAIEADDVDSRSNNPGTGITALQQQTFIRTLAAEAHQRGMAYALKSDLDDIGAVLNDVDFDINEECSKYGECDALLPFVRAGKAVFAAEYTDGDLAVLGATVCPPSNALGIDTIVKHLDLGPERFSCR